MGGKSVVALILACAVGLLVACGGGGGGGGGVDSPSNTNQPPRTEQPSSTNTNQPSSTEQPSGTNTNQPSSTEQPSTEQPSSTEQPPTDEPITPAPSFTSYLSDAAVEGVEYSGSAGNGVTGEGGVFTVGVGVIRFFIGGTTLGSVQINENWDNAHLTPADFVGVDMAGVISITRILQGLDEDGNPQNGISISQTARAGAQNLFDDLTESGTIAVISGKTYSIPSANEAMRHFVATRRCIFSGVYVGGYKATVGADISDERPGYFIFEPFANRVRGEFSAGNDFELMSVAITVGETRSVVTLSAGNELDFVTPRLVTGIWSSGTVSGTNRFTLLAGDPTATLRIVGIEIDEGRTVSGLYALDYFDSDGSFRGQYYDVETDKISVLSYELQGGAWPAAMMTANLTLRGNDDITLEFARKDDNYGEFEGIGDYDGLSGTWCDFGGSGKPIAPIAPIAPVTPTAATQSDSAISITWSAVAEATHYKLYRSATSGESFTQIGGDITATDYVDDSDLAANTAYYYQLESCNDNGCSDRSREVSATTAPATPLNPTAAAQSDDTISITWSAVADATHYKLYRATVSGGLLTPIGGEIATTEYVDRGLDANTSYYYRLESCNDNGCSGRSREVSATTYPPAPDAPEIPTADTQSDSEIEISWGAVARAMRYKLYRSTVSGGSYSQIGGDIAAISYRDSALSVKTAYYYQLEACNSGGCSGRSPEVAASTYGSLGAARDEITAGLTDPRAIAFSGGRAYVVDSDIDKIISYPVEEDGGLGAGRDEITTGLFVPRAIAFSGGRAYVADFIKNKIISYAVEEGGNLGAGRDEITSGLSFPSAIAFSGDRVYVAAGSFPGEIISYAVEEGGNLGAGRDEITTDLPLPSAIAFSGGRAYVTDANLDKIISYPEGVSGSLGAGRDEITTGLSFPSAIAFSGDRAYVADIDLAKIISYAVEANGSLGAGRDEITTGLDQPFAVAFLGKRVYVADIDLAKIISYPLFSPVSFAVAPDAPRVVTQSDSEIEIAWNAVSGATHYKLYRSATSGGLFAPVGGDISVTRYRDDDFLGDAFYYYQLEACSGDECSERSPAVGSVPATPSTPMAATQSDSAISIRWSEAAGATHYKLYRSETSEGSFTQIGGNITATDYVDDSDLAANTSYYYQVESCNDNGCSGRSPEVSATTAPARPSAPATPTAATQSDSAISITWSAVAGATHYKLYRSETSGGSFDQIGGDIAATDYVDDSGLTANTPYYYQLEACNSGGCSGRSFEVACDGALGESRDETGGLGRPYGIAISGGRAYVADRDLGKIISYPVGEDGSLGVALDEITTGLMRPAGIAITGGRVYVVDIGLDKIISYPVEEDGGLGAARDEITTGLSSPFGIAIAGGRVYVANQGFSNIISYPVGEDGGLGAARNEVMTRPSVPVVIAIAGGRAYVADFHLDKITSYPVETDGELGAGRDEITTGLQEPVGIAIAGNRVYVTGGGLTNGRRNNSKIISYPVNADGSLGAARDEIIVDLNFPVGIAIAGGRAYVADADITGGEDRIVSYPVGDDGELGAARDETTIVDFLRGGIAIAGGRTYLTDGGQDKIISYPVGADGGLGAARDEITTALSSPEGIAIAGGRAYVADSNLNKIISYPVREDGSLGAARDEITTGLSQPRAVAIAGGRAYVTDEFRSKIFSYPVGEDGELGAVREEAKAGFISRLRSIVFSGGRAYVADPGPDRIVSYPVNADGSLGAPRNEITTGLNFPSGVAIASGRAYVTEYETDLRSREVRGKIISYPVEAGGELGAPRDETTIGLSSPADIAISGGRVYVKDSSLRKIISYPCSI